MELGKKVPKLHVALTGSPGAGKTTYVKKLVKHLNESKVPCYGFVTEEVRDSNHKRIGFDVVSLEGKREAFARINTSGVNMRSSGYGSVGPYVVDVKAFEAFVLPLLSAEMPESSVIVIDEIGKMELLSSKFAQKIKELLSSSNLRMLVTIPMAKTKDIPLVAEIKMRNDFLIETITKQNRNEKQMFENLEYFFCS